MSRSSVHGEVRHYFVLKVPNFRARARIDQEAMLKSPSNLSILYLVALRILIIRVIIKKVHV